MIIGFKKCNRARSLSIEGHVSFVAVQLNGTGATILGLTCHLAVVEQHRRMPVWQLGHTDLEQLGT